MTYLCFRMAVLLWLLAVSAWCRAEEVRGSPAAHVLPGEFASEHWEFTARFDSGHLLFIEFIVTNIGLGDRNAAVLGHVVFPDGKVQRFTNGRREGNWTLAPDRLRMEVGASLLDLHGPLYQLQVSKRSVKLDVRFRPDAQPLWAQAISPPGYALDLLAVAATTEGTLWVNGMAAPVHVRGRIAATHSWTNTVGSALILRRVEFFSLQERCPVYAIDLTAPDGTRRRWLVVRAPDQADYASEHFDLAFTGALHGISEHGYEVPGMLQLKNAHLEGQVRLESLILQVDPLVDLPRPFHYLVSLALNLRPRKIWALSQLETSFCAAVLTTADHGQEKGITAVTFLNPLPPSLMTTHRVRYGATKYLTAAPLD